MFADWSARLDISVFPLYQSKMHKPSLQVCSFSSTPTIKTHSLMPYSSPT